MSDPAMAPSEDASPHFVLKKGHRGRYRFTLIVGANRLTGEVNTMNGWSSRSAQDAKALSEIGALAECLVAAAKAHSTALEPHPVIPEEQSEDPKPGSLDAACHVSIGERAAVAGSPAARRSADAAQIHLSQTRSDGAEP